MHITYWKLALLFGLLACSGGTGHMKHDGAADTRPPELDGHGGQTMDVAGLDGEASACRMDKIAFSQDTGCQNDNAVEFCIPANDALAASQVKSIAPTLACSRGAGGRAGCEPGSEQLCQLPIPREQCPYGSSMPDEIWASVCRLAAIEAVTRIVPTWYE